MHLKSNLVIFLVFFCLIPHSFATQAEDRLPIYIVIKDNNSPIVNFVGAEHRKKLSKVAAIGGLLGGGIGGLIGGSMLESEIQEYNEELKAKFLPTFGEWSDKKTILVSTITKAMSDNYPLLKPVILPAYYTDNNELELSNDAYSGTKSLLVIDVTLGLSTPAPEALWGSLSAYSSFNVKGYNTLSKKLIFEEQFDGVGPSYFNLDNIVESDKNFNNDLRISSERTVLTMLLRLSGLNYYHIQAQNTPLANSFPSVQSFLGDYSSQFSFKPIRFKKWRRPNTNNDFRFIAEPKKDSKYFGIVTDIDILAKELGQDFNTLDEYISHYLKKLIKMGWDVTPLPIPETMKFPEPWNVISLANPNGGVSVFAFRKEEEFIILHQAVFLGDNSTAYIKKYAKSVVRYVEGSQFKIKR